MRIQIVTIEQFRKDVTVVTDTGVRMKSALRKAKVPLDVQKEREYTAAAMRIREFAKQLGEATVKVS